MGVMNLAEIMDRAVDILKKYVATIVMFTIGYGIVMFIGLIVLTIAGVIFVAIAAGVLKNIIFTIVLVTILVIIVIAFYLSLNIGIIKITSQEFSEEKIYASTAIGASIKSFFKVLGITIISIILMIPAVVGFSAPVYFIYKISQSTTGGTGSSPTRIAMIIAIIIMILYIVAVITVVIGYITALNFSLQSLVIEKTGVIKSVKRSLNLVIHNFWRIYGCVVLFGLTIYAIQYSIMSFLGLIISIVFMIFKFLNLQQSYTTFLAMALAYSNWPISLISTCIISPLVTIMLTLIYYNERFKKEGYDMLLRLKKIQKSQEREHLNDSIEFNKSL